MADRARKPSVEFDERMQEIVDRYLRVSNLYALMSILVLSVFFAYAVWTMGTVKGLLAYAAVTVVTSAPLFDVRSESTLETDKSPEEVRDELDNLFNPFTALAYGWADEVQERSNADGTAAAVFDGTFFRWIPAEYRLRVISERDDLIRIRFGKDTPDRTLDLKIDSDADGTEITVEGHVPKVHGRKLVSSKLLHVVAERPTLEHFGYRLVDGSSRIRLRGT